jgi:hypothetical protein
MKVYWSIGQIPELADLSLSQRQAIWRQYCLQHAFKPKWFGLAVALSFGGGVAGLLAIHLLLGSNVAYPDWSGVAGGLGFGAGIFVFFQILIERLRPKFRERRNENPAS